MRFIKLIVLLFFYPFFAIAQTDADAREEKVRQIISDLPEVKAKDKVFDSISNRFQRVKMVVYPPSGAVNFYKVEVGYEGSNRFEPHFYFYVDPNDDQVFVEDMAYGDRVSLEGWRKRQTKSAAEVKKETSDIFGSPEPENDTLKLIPQPKADPVNVY